MAQVSQVMSRQRVTARSLRRALVDSRISNSPAAPRPIHGQTKAKANILGEASGPAPRRREHSKLHTHCGLNGSSALSSDRAPEAMERSRVAVEQVAIAVADTLHDVCLAVGG